MAETEEVLYCFSPQMTFSYNKLNQVDVRGNIFVYVCQFYRATKDSFFNIHYFPS